jgi:hypothetical protein
MQSMSRAGSDAGPEQTEELISNKKCVVAPVATFYPDYASSRAGPEQSAVLNNLQNFRGLRQSLNASKGSKIDWSKYRGLPLDSPYAKELAELQRLMKSELQAQIDALLREAL